MQWDGSSKTSNFNKTTHLVAQNLRPLQHTVPWGLILILILWRQRWSLDGADAILLMTSPACCGPSAIEIANLSRRFNSSDPQSHSTDRDSYCKVNASSQQLHCPRPARQPVNIHAGRRQSPDHWTWGTVTPYVPASVSVRAAVTTGCRDRSVFSSHRGPLTMAAACRQLSWCFLAQHSLLAQSGTSLGFCVLVQIAEIDNFLLNFATGDLHACMQMQINLYWLTEWQ